MKKLIFLGLSSCILAGCSSSISNSNQLVGNWRCTIDYDDFNIRTIDNLKFMASGNFSNRSAVSYPIQKPIFVYQLQQNGTWSLKGDSVVYRVASESIQRNHRAEIWSELQRDNDLEQFEESLFSSLSVDGESKSIEFVITDFNEDEMDIQQEIKGQSLYKGKCVKE